MTVQQPKRRPLSRYLKDFKHSQTHCAHCHKLLDRITLVRRGKIVNKIAISQLDMLLDDAAYREVNHLILLKNPGGKWIKRDLMG